MILTFVRMWFVGCMYVQYAVMYISMTFRLSTRHWKSSGFNLYHGCCYCVLLPLSSISMLQEREEISIRNSRQVLCSHSCLFNLGKSPSTEHMLCIRWYLTTSSLPTCNLFYLYLVVGSSR
ncbi:hypothetical protein F5B17DRAFT_263068 [Nemania serpens]|nr:hypothetical protein F5B17DRAFT_263068 [Nemania serpens]